MPQFPIGRLTRDQIVQRALRKSGNTTLGNAPTYEAQIWLNQLLFDLYTQYPLPYQCAETTLALSGLTFTLPSDFLQSVDDSSLAVTTLNGTPTYQLVREVSRREYEDYKGPGTATASVPLLWHADRNAGVGRIYPDPSPNAAIALFRYVYLPADIAIDPSGDATVPIFPYADFLIQALFTEILRYEQDGRANGELQIRELMLQNILNRATPLRAIESTIPLDPNVFDRVSGGRRDWGDWGW